MTEFTRILAPIRYPLTAKSTHTLAHADQLAEAAGEEGHLFVLHVDLFHQSADVHRAEIRRAVAPLLDDTSFSVILRRGYFVEEVIHEEAQRLDADTIVIGKNQGPRWQRLLRRLTRTDPGVESFLREQTGPRINVEVAE